ncbi:MAG: metalloregulator ArsR/SmtB family transcription factor [Ethanoligenens sp.]
MASEKDDGLCSVSVVHEDVVDHVKSVLDNDEMFYYMSEFFHMFDDPTRLKIIGALIVSEMCVCDIATVTGMSQSVISHHLKILRQARVIKFRREGKMAYYSLCDDHISTIFHQGRTHVQEKEERG